MAELLVRIDRFTDDYQPGFVECSFVDVAGARHLIHEKVPVVSQEDLSFDSTYPRTGRVACRVVEEWRDESGRYIARVSTEEPFHIESDGGFTEFVVPSTMVKTVREADAQYTDGIQLDCLPCQSGAVLVAVAQASKSLPVTSECPYCGSKLQVEVRGEPPSAWLHKCQCGKCTGSFRGL